MTSFLDVARYVSQFYGPLFREWKLRTKCFWLLRVLAFNGLHCSMPRPSSHIPESIVDSRLQRLVQHAANIYHRWQSSNGTFRWAPRQFTQWKVFAICVCVWVVSPTQPFPSAILPRQNVQLAISWISI